MTHLLHHVCDTSFAGNCDRFHRGPQLLAKIGRHADSLPVQIGVPFAESLEFDFRQIRSSLQRLQTVDQKLVSFDLVELDLGVDARGALVPRVGERLGIVPANGLRKRYEIRVPQVLTFGKSSLKFSNSLSLTRVWPLVTTVVDDANSRCSSVAWLYSPDLGNFPAESPLFFQAHSATFFDSGKSPLREVEDDHRS